MDEKGTEAAAATAVEVVATAPLNPFEMTVNRPFLFLIRHEPTETRFFSVGSWTLRLVAPSDGKS